MKTHKRKWWAHIKEWSNTWGLCGAFIFRGKSSAWWKNVDCRKCLKKGGRL